ncbi:hypothetical protein [Nocardioides aquiterrae]|uniref:Bacterial spore germination immunoglobulin-like domain-containing protein n=1 Tax=Nocardioides aquiterrae TaxID=203799 RepID=A0ABP4EVY8_9ACTN
MRSTTAPTAILLAAAVFAASSCSGSDSAGDASSDEPKDVTVTVELHDAPPLDALFNLDNVRCTRTVLGQTVDLQVTLRDADGTIVGTSKPPENGGSFSKREGCSWPVSFSVPESEFYEATVTTDSGDRKGTGQLDGTSAEIRVDL